MAIEATSNLATATSSLRLEDLLQVLLAELTNQNPLKPVENKDFLGQIAQFASLDSSQRLNQNIEQLLTLQAVNQSVGLIGKRVSAVTENGTIAGVVSALSLTGGVPRLNITDEVTGNVTIGVTLGELQTIRDLSAPAQPPTIEGTP